MKDSSPLDSRKYRMGLFCLMALLAGITIAMLNPVAANLYIEFASGVLGVYFVYCGGNIANKWTIGKTKSLTPPTRDNNIDNEGESSNGPIG